MTDVGNIAAFSLEPHARRVDKPWGYEILLSPADAPYTSKLIHVKAGKRLSLQLHDIKVETQTLVAGHGMLVLEGADSSCTTSRCSPASATTSRSASGTACAPAPDADATVFESSTPEAGTTLRLEDDYGRPDETLSA